MKQNLKSSVNSVALAEPVDLFDGIMTIIQNSLVAFYKIEKSVNFTGSEKYFPVI